VQRLQKTPAPAPAQNDLTIKKLTAELEAARAKNSSLTKQLDTANSARNTAQRLAAHDRRVTLSCKKCYSHLAYKYNTLCARTAAKQAPAINPYGSMDPDTAAAIVEAVNNDMATAGAQHLGLTLGLKGNALPDDPANPLEIFRAAEQTAWEC
jgi:flagellar motility protein MotE (MotC chaperone)